MGVAKNRKYLPAEEISSFDREEITASFIGCSRVSTSRAESRAPGEGKRKAVSEQNRRLCTVLTADNVGGYLFGSCFFHLK